MTVSRRARRSGFGGGLVLGLLVWATGTAVVVGLDLDGFLTSRLALGPARVIALAGVAHLGLGVISLLRLGTSGLVLILARAVLHALLALATVLALVLAGDMAIGAAVARATWHGPLVLLVQLVSAGLILAPLEASPLPRQRHARTGRPGGSRSAQSAGRSPARRGGVVPTPTASVVPAGPSAVPALGPDAAPAASSFPIPALVEATGHAVPYVNGAPGQPADADQGPRREAPAAPAAEAPVASRAEDSPAAPEVVDPTVRIPFERVADQLPADAFRIPLDRVGTSLLEPGYLLVPQRLLVTQVAEGQASVAWNVVAEQFPHQVLAGERSDVGRRLPGGALALPLDEVVRQLPPDLFVVPGETPDMRSLEDFPLPFQPHVPPPSEERVEAGEPSPAGTRDSEPRTEPEPVEADPEPAPVEVAAAPPEAEAEPAAPTEEVPIPEPAGLPGALGLPGAWQLRTHRLDGLCVITLTGSDVAPEAAARLAADLAGLLDDPRLPAPASQLTVRGPGATLVVTPIDAVSAGGPILAATAEPGAALAQLERAALRMARVSGDGRRGAAPEPSDLAEAPVSPAVRDAAQRMRAFGTLTPTVLQDGTGLTLYLLLAPGAAARLVAGWARDLRRTVQGALVGSLESAMVRLGEDRLLIREVPAGRGAAAVLVVGGAPLSRPGLARLELERAVARLGAG